MTYSKIAWSKQLTIGNDLIDKDHSWLLEIYNDLVDQIYKNGSNEDFAISLSKMSDYSRKHFINEEKYMLELKYPEFRNHKKLHNSFITEVAQFNFAMLTATAPDPVMIANYILNWWKYHITVHDISYENFKAESGTIATYTPMDIRLY